MPSQQAMEAVSKHIEMSTLHAKQFGERLHACEAVGDSINGSVMAVAQLLTEANVQLLIYIKQLQIDVLALEGALRASKLHS